MTLCEEILRHPFLCLFLWRQEGERSTDWGEGQRNSVSAWLVKLQEPLTEVKFLLGTHHCRLKPL